MSKTLRRTIHPEVRVVDSKRGIAEYVASDETVDSYREVIRAAGWRFSMFRKNAPFVDSHNYDSLESQLGKVIDYRVDGDKLIERVQWAIDVPENKLAALGWKMTEAGYLKAVSVGFWPSKAVSRHDRDQREEYLDQLEQLGHTEESGIRTIFLEQEQVELSACIIGANPNALAKAYKAEVINDADLETISEVTASRVTAKDANHTAEASTANYRRAQLALHLSIQAAIRRL